jgi:hypothetical protein
MTVTENDSRRARVWPADYYSSATPAPVLPQWATFGCGAAAVVMLILVFAGGAFLSSGGFSEFMNFAIGMSVSEMKGQYAADVSTARKKSLADEISRMQKNLGEQKLTVTSLQTFLERLRTAGSDKKITAQEAAALEETARKVNATAAAKGKPPRRIP